MTVGGRLSPLLAVRLRSELPGWCIYAQDDFASLLPSPELRGRELANFKMQIDGQPWERRYTHPLERQKGKTNHTRTHTHRGGRRVCTCDHGVSKSRLEKKNLLRRTAVGTPIDPPPCATKRENKRHTHAHTPKGKKGLHL